MKPLNEMSLSELKSLAYDQIVIFEQTQNNLKLINTRIAELSQPQPASEVKQE